MQVGAATAAAIGAMGAAHAADTGDATARVKNVKAFAFLNHCRVGPQQHLDPLNQEPENRAIQTLRSPFFGPIRAL